MELYCTMHAWHEMHVKPSCLLLYLLVINRFVYVFFLPSNKSHTKIPFFYQLLSMRNKKVNRIMYGVVLYHACMRGVRIFFGNTLDRSSEHLGGPTYPITESTSITSNNRN